MTYMAIPTGSEMDVENDSGATALMVAAHNGHTEVVEALIDAGMYLLPYCLSALLRRSIHRNMSKASLNNSRLCES